MQDPGAVVDEVNRRHGSAWRLLGKLPGGYQGGAYLLDPSAVLKWLSPGWSPERLDATRALIERACAVGWPTPRWLAHGILDDGSPYVVTTFASGTHPAVYDEATVDALLGAVRIQAGLMAGDPCEQDWSRRSRAVTFGGSETERQRDDLKRFSPAGERLVAAIDDRCADLAGLKLPTDDLVHGDLCSDNAHFEGDRLVALVDAQHAGRGTRAVDIAGMLRHAAFLDAPTSILQSLRDSGDAVAGSDVFAVCLAARILDVLSFGTWNWPDEVDAAIGPLQALLNE